MMIVWFGDQPSHWLMVAWLGVWASDCYGGGLVLNGSD